MPDKTANELLILGLEKLVKKLFIIIEDNNRIMDLQTKVIDCQNRKIEQLKSVKTKSADGESHYET